MPPCLNIVICEYHPEFKFTPAGDVDIVLSESDTFDVMPRSKRDEVLRQRISEATGLDWMPPGHINALNSR